MTLHKPHNTPFRHIGVSSMIRSKRGSLTLIDSGESAHGLVDIDHANKKGLELTCLDFPRSLQVLDGTELVSENIAHFVKVTLTIAGYSENTFLLVARLTKVYTVLGLPWLCLVLIGQMRQWYLKIPIVQNTV